MGILIPAGSGSSFTLSRSASTLSVAQGGNGTDTITLADAGGFTGAVSFAATGLPSGVTASFSPTSSTTSSVLTLTASSTAATGTSTVTITGTSGSLTASTTISLTVTGGSCTPTAIVPYISRRRAVVQQLQNLDFRILQSHPGAFQVRFVLHALKLQPIEIDLRDAPHAELLPADGEYFVVVIEVRLEPVPGAPSVAASARRRVRSVERSVRS